MHCSLVWQQACRRRTLLRPWLLLLLLAGGTVPRGLREAALLWPLGDSPGLPDPKALPAEVLRGEAALGLRLCALGDCGAWRRGACCCWRLAGLS